MLTISTLAGSSPALAARMGNSLSEALPAGEPSLRPARSATAWTGLAALVSKAKGALL